MRLARFALALALGTSSCAGSPQNGATRPDVPATSWRYEVKLDDTLARMDVGVCFTGPAPRELRPGRDEAASRLLHAHWLRPGAKRKLRVVGGRIQLEGAPSDGCMTYAVSLSAGGSLRAAVRRVGRDLLASPSAWLWRPERRAASARASLTMTLPVGMSALLPWPERGGRRVLDARAFRFESYAAFGRFTPVVDERDGVRIEHARLDGALAIDAAATRAWLRDATAVVTQSDGRFPRARVSAIVVPSEGGTEPVPFGMVARGGDVSLLLMMSRAASPATLGRDWVLPHELSHLLLPFVEREHAWLSEGFATYCQEVLRARAGLQSERDALRKIVLSLRAVANVASSASLVEASARVHDARGYERVYWGGAALFFKADVALRQRTQGHVTLDDVTAQLRQDPRSDEVWEPDALFRRLDLLSGTQVFDAALREATKRSLPDLESTLSQLGVRIVEDDVVLDDAAPLAELRRAVFAPRARRSTPPARAAPP